MSKPELIGRSSSHFTRLALILGHETKCTFQFRPVFDLTTLDPAVYGGNPSLRIPIWIEQDIPLFGTINICRAMAKSAQAEASVFWPEEHSNNLLLQNANELIMSAMATQVTLVFSKFFAQISPENLLFKKSFESLCNMLEWLEQNIPGIQKSLPGDRISILEAALFCLLRHLEFRETLEIDSYPRLQEFAQSFSQRKSAVATRYKMDTPPVGNR